MSSYSEHSTELEATLAICAERPDTAMRKIGELTFVGDYRLVPQPAELIHDIYFDTTDGALRSAKWALRLREIEERHWIALKGPALPADSGGVRRVEMELTWSADALEEVLTELSAHELISSDAVKLPASLRPREALIAVGFRIVQDRKTRRQLRDIVSPQGERVAEMALDSVAYHLSAGQILHEEIEIESKAPSGSMAIDTILDHLTSEFGSLVRKWDFGKLATGLALERLLGKGRAPDLVASDGYLAPAAYESLAILLA